MSLRDVFIIREGVGSQIPEQALVDVPDDPHIVDLDNIAFDEAIQELKGRGFQESTDDVMFHPRHWRVLNPSNPSDARRATALKWGERAGGRLWYRGFGHAYVSLTPEATEWGVENPPPDRPPFDLNDPETAERVLSALGKWKPPRGN